MLKLYTLLLTGSLLLAGCSSDPLDQKYAASSGLDPIIPPGDTHRALYRDCIIMALHYNDSVGVSSEGKTFRKLYEQGRDIWAERKTKAFTDSVLKAYAKKAI